MNKAGILFFLLLIALSACRDDINDVTITEETPEPPLIEGYEPKVVNIVGSAIGFVVDESNDPVIDAEVQFGNQTIRTDEYGHFFINNAIMNARGTLIQVEKAGYFNGSRRFFPTSEHQSRIKIQLLRENFDYSFESTDGGEVRLENGSINFKANSIADASGQIYSGQVQVAAKWLDPIALQTLDQMPGNLQGVNTSNEEVALTTYGMIAVELRGEAGQKLNIVEGSTATISMPIPNAIRNAAPTQIPLWSYNETYGVWVEESEATIEDNAYVGEVSHFSFWNCDFPGQLIILDFDLIDENGDPLSNYLARLYSDGVGTGYGYSDTMGHVSGGVPANVNLVLEVINTCGVVIHTENIGPFTDDTSLGAITVSNASIDATTITGQLVNCDNDPVANGVVIATYEGISEYHYTNGDPFTFSFSTCPSTSEVHVQGIDLDNNVQSEDQTANTGIETNFGNIDVCDIALENYIEVTIDGVTQIYPNAISIDSLNMELTISAFNQNNRISFSWEGSTAGDYSDANHLQLLTSSINPWTIFNESFSSLVVTEHGSMSGEFIRGTFEGDVINNPNSNPTTVHVNGEFSITIP